ncbi:MAG: ADP-forming succinate--CoA ligase subunit beta [Flavobacteriaceae bacterium]|nr:ADP-forming succinate--CoA ligase subunit beta [Flavobacteriaceae bacterium]
MNLHEHQAKKLFKEFGLPTSNFTVINSHSEAQEKAKQLNVNKWVVKAQVHAGGRGKAGGVKLVDDLQSVEDFAKKWLGNNLVTYQTDQNGQPVSSILIEECTDIDKELYLGVVIDRSSQSIVVMASPEGGVDIESVAEKSPEKIFKVSIDLENGPEEKDALFLSKGLNLSNSQTLQFIGIFKNLSRLFVEKDLALVEINPLVIDANQNLKCLDGKISVDTNSLYRQDDILEMRDISQEEERELRASEWDLNYVALDGNIGCMVNGAGLAMGTMDMIKIAGGFPANFLDVGGSVNKNSVSEAFKIILSDEKVKAILINIFGGIVRCDIVAEGIIEAVKEVGVSIPVIVRLKGNNSNLAQEILDKSALNIISESSLSKAAQRAVDLSK